MQARQFVKKELPVLLDGLAFLDATELISKIENKIKNNTGITHTQDLKFLTKTKIPQVT